MHFTLSLPSRCSCAAIALAVLAAGGPAYGAPLPASVRAAAERYLTQQAQGAPGEVIVRVNDPGGAPLPPCEAVQPFLPAGVAAWGRLSLGIRCAGERPWTRFVTAQVSIEGRYLVAARAIPAGKAIGPEDLREASGDLTKLPRTVGTAAELVLGMVALNAIAAGTPVRLDRIRASLVIRQGQTVRVVAQGAGFAVSTEARALAAATSGAAVQVKTVDGRTLTGIARDGGRVVLGH